MYSMRFNQAVSLGCTQNIALLFVEVKNVERQNVKKTEIVTLFDSILIAPQG
jgi:hypothetical protein